MSNITKAEMRKRLGNITQLQDILFGEQVEEFDRKLAEFDRRLIELDSNQKKLQLVFEERLTQLENNLSHKINVFASSLDKKVKYLDISSKKEQNKIQQDLDAISQYSYENVDFLQNSLNTQANNLKTEIAQSKSSLDRDLKLLKQQVMERLDAHLTDLSAGKVSRSDLAEVLFQLCLSLREPEASLQLPEATEKENSAGLMLNEEKQTIDPTIENGKAEVDN
ncbi:MAG: hypothetical protein QNJ72_11840 [Pleurocapsa sp. MO_226.B13]|nr:hypothetical protein [Pleurocapsa sp. MO_226.B13]